MSPSSVVEVWVSNGYPLGIKFCANETGHWVGVTMNSFVLSPSSTVNVAGPVKIDPTANKMRMVLVVLR